MVQLDTSLLFCVSIQILCLILIAEAARAFEMAINIYTDMVGEIDHIKNLLNFIIKLQHS